MLLGRGDKLQFPVSHVAMRAATKSAQYVSPSGRVVRFYGPEVVCTARHVQAQKALHSELDTCIIVFSSHDGLAGLFPSC